MGGVQEAVGSRRPGRVHEGAVLQHDRGQPGLRRPPRRPGARRLLHRQHGHLRPQLWLLAWHGECDGDALRPSLRCKAVLRAWHLPAAFVTHSPWLRRAPCSDVHLQRAAPRRVGPARGAVARGRLGQHVHAPAALHLRHHPAAQQVPAVPAQELGRSGDHGRGVPGARRGDLAAGALLRARGLRRRDGTQLVPGARVGAATRLRLRRWVPGNVEGVLGIGIRGLERFRQVVRGVWCHALFGELVLPDIDFPDGVHEERRISGGCTAYLYEFGWMGDDDSFGIS